MSSAEVSMLREYYKPLAVVASSLILGRGLMLLLGDKNKSLVAYLKNLLGIKPAMVPVEPIRAKGLYSGQPLVPPVITPVPDDFDWTKEEPFPFRPFKNGEYRMTLAIRKQDPRDFIVVEDTYLERTNIRKKTLETKRDIVFGCHESATEPLREFYDMVMDFFPKKYPMLFYFKNDPEGNYMFYNSIRDEYLPPKSDGLSGESILEYLNRTLEEDFLILIKNPEEGGLDEYYLRGVISCFPAGFNPASKFNLPMTAIHAPVPGYKEKLQTSMNKFFAKLSPYEYIVRNNWSIQSHTRLCASTGSHQYRADEDVPVLNPDELDFNKVFLRVEKQSFTRLPKTRADLMLIRTYVTPLTKIKAEGRGDVLIGGIDGMPTDLGVYKRRIAWGEAVKAYLRGESNGCTDEVYDYKFVE